MLRKGLGLVLAFGLVGSAFASKSDKTAEPSYPKKIERFCENVQKADFPSASTYLSDSIEKLGKLLKDGEKLPTSLIETSKDRLCNQIKALHEIVKSDSKRVSSFNTTFTSLRNDLRQFLPKKSGEKSKNTSATTAPATVEPTETEDEVEMP